MKIVLIGAGNVASHLGPALAKSGNKIVCVYSFSKNRAKLLGKKLHCQFTNNISEIPTEADIYFIAIRDEKIKDFVNQFPSVKGIVAHTSGTIPMKVFGNKFKNSGVFYPLQSFSEKRKVTFKDLPVCIEANNSKAKTALKTIAKNIKANSYFISSDDRKYLHLAAVFVNNFSNHLYSLAEDILKKKKLPFKVLYPLLLETAMKVKHHHPKDMQTGPAKRRDNKIIKEHLMMLKDEKMKKEIYGVITRSIENGNVD